MKHANVDHAGDIGSKTKPWPAPGLRSIFLAVLLRLPRWGPGAIATGTLARCQVPGRELTHRGYCHRTRGIAKFSILPRWGSVYVLHSNPLGNPKSDDSSHSPWGLYAMAALAKMPGQAKQQQARRVDVDSLIMMIRVKCTG